MDENTFKQRTTKFGLPAIVASIKTYGSEARGANPRSLKPHGDAEVGQNIAKSKATIQNPKSKIQNR
jgi:hypothetical protein